MFTIKSLQFNMNSDYTTVEQFLEEKSKLIGKIAAYDILIEKMEQALDTAATTGHILQYEMDDGQMKVRMQYRNMQQMIDALNGFMKMRQYYVNKHNGRITRLVGGQL